MKCETRTGASLEWQKGSVTGVPLRQLRNFRSELDALEEKIFTHIHQMYHEAYAEKLEDLNAQLVVTKAKWVDALVENAQQAQRIGLQQARICELEDLIMRLKTDSHDSVESSLTTKGVKTSKGRRSNSTSSIGSTDALSNIIPHERRSQTPELIFSSSASNSEAHRSISPKSRQRSDALSAPGEASHSHALAFVGEASRSLRLAKEPACATMHISERIQHQREQSRSTRKRSTRRRSSSFSSVSSLNLREQSELQKAGLTYPKILKVLGSSPCLEKRGRFNSARSIPLPAKESEALSIQTALVHVGEFDRTNDKPKRKKGLRFKKGKTDRVSKGNKSIVVSKDDGNMKSSCVLRASSPSSRHRSHTRSKYERKSKKEKKTRSCRELYTLHDER